MRKILEIGGGRTPYFIRYRKSWDTRDQFVSIDMDEKNLDMSKESIQKYIKEGKVVPIDPVFILSDASSLDISNGTIDEIIISNTLSAPIHRNWDRDGNKVKVANANNPIEKIIKNENDPEDPFYIERKKLVLEMLRVLKVGGKISVYTDLIIYGIHSYERILNELKALVNFKYINNVEEAHRVDAINVSKLSSKEFCCCFRAEVLPKSEVHTFNKIG